MEIRLQKDDSGNVVTCPVTGWGISPVAGMMLLLIIQYVETPEQLENGARLQLQGMIQPPQALQLAEELKKAAKMLLEPTSGTMLH